MGTDFGGAVLDALKFEEVVGPDHLASRSSEMIWVESVPPLNAPALRAASNSGISFLVAQYDGVGAAAAWSAAAMATSMM